MILNPKERKTKIRNANKVFKFKSIMYFLVRKKLFNSKITPRTRGIETISEYANRLVHPQKNANK
jgi:hypothetical protein